MKKLILLTVLLVSAFTSFAQDFGVYEYAHPHRTDALRTLYGKVTRYLARQQKLPWVRAVQRQVQKANPDRLIGLRWDFVSPLPPAQPSAQYARVFQTRLTGWQQMFAHHPVLCRFTLKAVRVADVVQLSPAQQASVTHFLQNGITVGTATPRYAPVQTEEFKHYLVRLTLPAPAQEKPVYLLINGHTREVFLSRTPLVPGLPLEKLSTGILAR